MDTWELFMNPVDIVEKLKQRKPPMEEKMHSSIIWLSQNKYTIIDNEDLEWLSNWKWCYNKKGYAQRCKRKDDPPMLPAVISLQRFIITATTSLVVDHINGNPLDNRKRNFRLCTRQENCRGGKLQTNNTSGYKGVTREREKYLAQIRFQGKVLRLGTFTSPQIAARVYDEAALKYHGEFARTNKMMGLI